MPETTVTVTAGMPTTVTVTGGVADVSIDVQRGIPGLNTITTATLSNLTGFIAANGTTVSGATAGSASATPSTLVLRNANGGVVFTSTTDAAALLATGNNASAGNFQSVSATAVNIFSSTGTGAAITSSTGTAAIIESGAGDHLNIGSGKVIVANNGNTTLTGAIAASNLSGTNTGDQFTSVTSHHLLGRHAGSTGSAQEVNVGNGIEFQGSGIRRSALTGDVTASAGSNSTTIANDSVTNAKLANVATATIKGRTTAGTGDPEDLTLGTGIEFSGSTIQRSALTGDITASAGSNATTLASTIAGAKTLSGQLELTGQAATTANSAMTRVLADNRTVAVHLGTNFIVNNSATRADTTMVLSLGVGTWELNGFFETSNAATGGSKVYIAVNGAQPESYQHRLTMISVNGGSTNPNFSGGTPAFGGGTAPFVFSRAIGSGAGSNFQLLPSVIVLTASATFTIGFSQNTAAVGDCTLFAFSRFWANRISH